MTVEQWQPIETIPKFVNKPILLGGRFRTNHHTIWVAVMWSSVQSNGTGYQWFHANSICPCPIDMYAVDWLWWTPIIVPEMPADHD